MNDDIELAAQQFAANLSDYIVATAAEENARQSFEGHSWDYVGYDLIEARCKARKALTESLTTLIKLVR